MGEPSRLGARAAATNHANGDESWLCAWVDACGAGEDYAGFLGIYRVVGCCSFVDVRVCVLFCLVVGVMSFSCRYSDEFRNVGGGDYLMSRVLDRGAKSPVFAVAHPSTTESWVILDRRDRVIFWEKVGGGGKRILVEASREASIFGQPDAESAVAEYLREEG